MLDFLLPLLLQGIVLPLSMLLDMLLCWLLYRSFCDRVTQQERITMFREELMAQQQRIDGLQDANDFLHSELTRVYSERPQGEWLHVLAIAPSGPSKN
jgi:hypothetical protein